MIRGGNWNNGANAGVFYFNGNNSRANGGMRSVGSPTSIFAPEGRAGLLFPCPHSFTVKIMARV